MGFVRIPRISQKLPFYFVQYDMDFRCIYSMKKTVQLDPTAESKSHGTGCYPVPWRMVLVNFFVVICSKQEIVHTDISLSVLLHSGKIFL